MTALDTPPGPVPVPAPIPLTPRTASVFANLMPFEVIATRRSRQAQRRVLIALLGVVVLVVLSFAATWLQTRNAQSTLSDEQSRTKTLINEQRSFSALVSAQTETTRMRATLQTLMIGDVQWTPLLQKLEASTPRGVALTDVTGTITSGAAAGSGSATGTAAGLAVLNNTGELQIGTLTLTGTAPDKNSVAAMVDKLTSIQGLAAPFPANVSGGRGNVTFSINAILTSKLLGGRFSPTPAKGGH